MAVKITKCDKCGHARQSNICDRCREPVLMSACTRVTVGNWQALCCHECAEVLQRQLHMGTGPQKNNDGTYEMPGVAKGENT